MLFRYSAGGGTQCKWALRTLTYSESGLVDIEQGNVEHCDHGAEIPSRGLSRALKVSLPPTPPTLSAPLVSMDLSTVPWICNQGLGVGLGRLV